MTTQPTPVLLNLYFGTLAVLALAAVAYSIATRTPGDYLLYTLLLAAMWTVLLVKWSLDIASSRGQPLPEPTFRGFVRLCTRVIPLAMTSYGVMASTADLYQWVASVKYGIAISAIALIFGVFLFAMREQARFLYGLIEVAVGLVVAGYRSDPSTSFWDLSAFLPFLTAGVYLVVRGFDNVSQGLRSPSDPIVEWLRRVQSPQPTQDRLKARRVKSYRDRKTKALVMKERLARSAARRSDP